MTRPINKKEIFDVIKTGNPWTAPRISDCLSELFTAYSNKQLSFDYSSNAGQGTNEYIFYSNECSITVSIGRMTIECQRENVFSSGVEIDFEVKSKADIEQAFERFISMTLEDETDDF
jgi:hypothetical protein